MEQEVLYERNMTGSYMKIEASEGASFDERMLFSGKISGLLPVEQCFLNGKAWYWYNISGKQSLDTCCKMQDIGILLIEKIIISICDEIDILEWNLFDLNCLLLSPEYIFINNINQEIIFTVYPGAGEDLSIQFRELMEYLLTKIDHKDVRAVQAAYGIYEKTLDEAYDIMDIRDYVVMGRTSGDEESQKRIEEGSQDKTQLQIPDVDKSDVEPVMKTGGIKGKNARNRIMQEETWKPVREDKKSVFTDIMQLLSEWKQSIRRVKKSVEPGQSAVRYPNSYNSQMESSWMGDTQVGSLQVAEHMKYGRNGSNGQSEWYGGGSTNEGSGWQDKSGMDTETGWYGSRFGSAGAGSYGGSSSVKGYEAGQTTVLSGYGDFIKGVLVYEGTEGLENISLQQRSVQIGKLPSLDVCIPQNTISQFHAKISYKDGDYLLEDLNSTNGTYVNEKALVYKEIRKLAMNDIVRFADVSYRFI